MAQKTVVVYTDDLTGEQTEDASSHTIALDGVTYELDLTPESYDKLWEAIAPFTKAGRKVKKTRAGTSPHARRAASSGSDTAAIRDWAKKQGYEVNDRGRVPASIREAYEKAN